MSLWWCPSCKEVRGPEAGRCAKCDDPLEYAYIEGNKDFMGHGTEHRQNDAMQEAAERTWPGLSEGSPRPETDYLDDLRRLEVENLHLRGCLETVLDWLETDVRIDGAGPNGGGQLRVDRVRSILSPSALLPSSEEGDATKK